MLRASFDTERVADGLRRYQKFTQPGPSSPHIVLLRQQQAARQASSQAKQWFIAAATFVQETEIEVRVRVALEVLVDRWIEANVPTDVAMPTR